MTAVSAEAPPRTGSRRELRLILVFAFLGSLFDGAEINLVGYPLTYLSGSLHVSTVALVSVATFQGFASIAGGFLFGWLGDTLGRRRTYAISVLAFGVAAVLGGLAPSFGTFLATRLLAGLGMGGLFGLSFSMFTECWKTTRRGTMGGLIQSMYFLGEIVTVGVLYACLSWFGNDLGWRTGYVVIGVVSVVIGLAAFRLLPESRHWLEYQRRLREGTVPPELRRTRVPILDVFRSKVVYGSVIFMVLSTAMFLTTNSVGVYLSTYLLKVQHLPLGTASGVVLIGYVFTILAYSATGALSDLVRRKYAFLAACVFGVAGFGWFLGQVLSGTDHVSSSFWGDTTFWALMWSAAACGGFGVLGVWMSEYYPTRIRSTGANSSYYVGRGLGAGVYPLFALTLAGGGIPLALALGILGPLAGIVFSAIAPDRTGRDIVAIE
ncbi:MFS transporter [Amycolatopsis sp. NPDC051372]|uniref:MFS transporter n=1 Tax=Amycolatopsis sp. NPDC051372 TaxID=3155669 RepID=UPI00341FBE44